MRRYATALWSLAALVMLALLATPIFGTPVSAAPLGNLTGTPTEPPTQTPTNTPTDAPTATPTDVSTATPTEVSTVVPSVTPGGPTLTPTPPTATPGGPTVTPPDQTQVLPPTPSLTPERFDDDGSGRAPAVSLVKQADRTSARPGDSIAYTITVVNSGSGRASNVVISDSLPEGLDIVEVVATRGDVVQDGRRVTVTIGDLLAGETVTIVVRGRVQEGVSSDDLNNLAEIESGPPEGRTRQQATVQVALDRPTQVSSMQGGPAITPTPLPRSAPLPEGQPVVARLPRTGTLFADVSDAALLLVLAAAALFCLSIAVRTYLSRR